MATSDEVSDNSDKWQIAKIPAIRKTATQEEMIEKLSEDSNAFIDVVHSKEDASVDNQGEAEPASLSTDEIHHTTEQELQQIKDRLGQSIPFQLVITLGVETLEEPAFDQDLVMIGRDESCDVVVDNLGASRSHAEIIRIGKFHLLRDLGSKTGTFIRGKRITEYCLNDGDEIFLAKHTIIFRRLDENTDWQALIRKKRLGDRSQKMRPTVAMDFGNIARKKETNHTVLTFLSSNRSYTIEKNTIFFGKASNCDIRVNGFMVGERHVALVQEKNGLFVYHLGWFRPPKVNGQFVSISQIKDNDILEIGDIKFSIQVHS